MEVHLSHDDDEVRRALATGRQEFMGLDFVVERGALVPRRETELLARTAIEKIQAAIAAAAFPANPVIFDLCCGVGNLACAISTAIPEARIFASDISLACVELAKNNVQRHGLGARVTILFGDLLEPYRELGMGGQVSAIVCNPPYISTGRLQKGFQHLEHEPIEAFAAGPYGIAIHQRISREAPLWLHPGGLLLFEYGAGQGRQAQMLLERTGRYESLQLIQPDQDKAGTACATLSA